MFRHTGPFGAAAAALALVSVFSAPAITAEGERLEWQLFEASDSDSETTSRLSSPPVSPRTSDTQAEKDDFDAAKDLGTAHAWNAFLAKHSSGFYADIARAYLKTLADNDEDDTPSENDGKARMRPSGVGPSIPAQTPVTASGTTRQISCAESARSRDNAAAAKVTFVNASGAYRALLWLDSLGQPTSMAALEPGEQVTVETFVTHPWMVATGPGDCLQIFMPSAGSSTVILSHISADDAPPKQGPAITPLSETPLEDAWENCKETGGQWTGTVCKPSKKAHP